MHTNPLGALGRNASLVGAFLAFQWFFLHKGSCNRSFLCIEATLKGGFGCLELVLYGIRVLAEQHYEQDPTNQSKSSLELDQSEWRTLVPANCQPVTTNLSCSEEDSLEEYFIAPAKHKNGVVGEPQPDSKKNRSEDQSSVK